MRQITPEPTLDSSNKANVHGHDAAGHVDVASIIEAGVFHHCFQAVLVWMHATDRFGEVLVAVFVLGDPFADFG